ncbi:MAG: phosphotransferase [Deltaproteobacteria bacterium]|nr:phosphotransferase [Deltaproteobacteria bacterium]
MGRDATTATTIEPAQIQAYLRHAGFPDAIVKSLAPLGQKTQEGLKGFGYGRPLRVSFASGGATRDLVVRTMSPDPFGHNRRSARAETLILCFDTFNTFPGHIRATDIGAFTESGELLPMGRGEVFLVTEYVDGELYARDLSALQSAAAATDRDRNRAVALARYLAALHSQPAAPEEYGRAVRDLVGSGEGIFGLVDSYPKDLEIVPAARLRALEALVIDWRWRIKDRAHRARRTHGDFHPFNLLFRDGVDFSVLDCSRGAAGEAADDVTCLSINYLFFALTAHGKVDGPLLELWQLFWRTYLEASGDQELLEVVPPFFAWRALVLASPVWYPQVENATRDRLLVFAERLLAGTRFEPARVAELFA